MANNYGRFPEPVRGILFKHSLHPLPLTRREPLSSDVDTARDLQAFSPPQVFPEARAPEAAVSGLLLLIGCWDESHKLSQDIASAEGSYWHAIVHRMEPDAKNAAYWFGQVGEHPIFPDLYRKASEILNRHKTGWRLRAAWDARVFIDWCDEARRDPGTERENAALEIQDAEWNLLFEWCALPALRNDGGL